MMTLPAFATCERGRFLAGWCAGEAWALTLPAAAPAVSAGDHDHDHDSAAQAADNAGNADHAAAGEPRRTLLCEAGAATGAGVSVLSCLGRFVMVCVKRGSTKAPLQIFDLARLLRPAAADHERVTDGGELAVRFAPDNKQRGLCAVVPVAGDGRVLLGCGRGIGTGHVWVFDPASGDRGDSGDATAAAATAVAAAVRYLGKVRVSGSTIIAMSFSQCGRHLVTVVDDGATATVAQRWALPALPGRGANDCQPFDIRAGQSERIALEVGVLVCALGDGDVARAAAIELLGDVANATTTAPDPALWVAQQPQQQPQQQQQQQGLCWGALFPPRLLDPLAYDGSVDSAGRPHGFGAQALDGDANRVYEGDWKHGVRHGKGELVDVRLDTVLYSGGWKDGVQHGYGRQVRPATGERFDGWFRNGERHGLGVLVLSNKESLLAAGSKAWRKRVRVTGFFRGGRRHGLSWTTFPKECPAVPFAVTPGSIQHLLPICCVMQHSDGEFMREFGYHRADGVSLSAADRDLFNFKAAMKRKSFSDHADGHWSHGECWACLEEAGDDSAPGDGSEEEKDQVKDTGDELLVCGNHACQMRVHARCLGHANARRLFLTDQCEQWYCSDLAPAEAAQLRAFRPPRGLWYCPMPSCQAQGKRALSGSGAETAALVQAAAAARAAEKHAAAKAAKARPRKRPPGGNKSNKSNKNKKVRGNSKRATLLDVEAALRALTGDPPPPAAAPAAPAAGGLANDPSLADLKMGLDPHTRLEYYDHLGQAWLVETQADLEEARQAAFLANQGTLHLYLVAG